VKLIHSGLNSIFNIIIIFISNYFLISDDVLINSLTLLVIDFVNLKDQIGSVFQRYS
jgi:hypothetical protein